MRLQLVLTCTLRLREPQRQQLTTWKPCSAFLLCLCLLAGEVTWVKRNMEKHHEAAAKKGVKIVHCCGYDSVPSGVQCSCTTHLV